MQLLSVILMIVISFSGVSYTVAKSGDKNVIDNIVDIKEFKKLLRTKTNVLVYYYLATIKQSPQIKVFKDAANEMRGEGTLVLLDCSGSGKKLCKKMKVAPDTFIIKHYKDGEFNRDYDRKMSVVSMVTFMRDPTGDIPWEEDTGSPDVLHLKDMDSLAKLLKKEHKPIMIMFYAPWCGFCKTLKPEYASAATDLKGHSILAAIDCDRPTTTNVRAHFNITGFPTLLYFSKGVMEYQYDGENTKDGIVQFMHNPQPLPPKVLEPEWPDTDSDVVHLTSFSFDPVIREESSLLVMFYAPWCDHCKTLKPEYEKAAVQMRNEGVSGMLAAVDVTKEPDIGSRYDVKGYPTIKYFSFGEVKYDVNIREAPKIVEFMKNPQEPRAPLQPEVPWTEDDSPVVHLTEETFKPFLKKKKHVLVMFYAPWCGYCKKAKPEFIEASDFFKDDAKVEFAVVDCTTHKSICSANDVKGYPTLKYFSYYSKVVRKYSGGRTSADFISYMQNPENPPVPAHVLSKKDEWVNASPNVIVLNDHSFKALIKSNAPVLVMFYAPWCGHCKKLKPQYLKAADELRAEGFAGQLAVIDCTENPIITEEYEISGFPTIKLFIKGKYVTDYDGPRSPEDLKKFMKNQYPLKKEEL